MRRGALSMLLGSSTHKPVVRPTTLAGPAPCQHVAMITDRLLSGGRWTEGGAERHLWHLARTATMYGVRVTVYQAAPEPFSLERDGIRLVGLRVPAKSIWAGAVRHAVNDRATHLYFQYIDRVPCRPLPLPISAASHGVYWDHPYDRTMSDWYPHGPFDRILLPLWRHEERLRVMANVARCSAVLSTDSSFYHVVQSEAPRLRARVYVVYNFYDLDDSCAASDARADDARGVLAPLHRARAENRVVVLVPRNLSLVRGGGWLPRIVDLVTKKTGGLCQFAMCGTSVQTQGRAGRYERALDVALRGLPAASRGRLTFLGGVPHELMRRAYDLSDIVLIPTYSHESTSLAAIEAMSRGRPVVASNVGGLSDVVADGWTGLLATPTVGALADAVARLASDAEMRVRLGGQSAVEARGRFSLEQWQHRIVSFMEGSGWLG